MDKEARKILSDRFRAFCGTLPLPILREWEFTLRDALGFKDVRNVQLFTRNTSQNRQFIGNSLSGRAFWKRVHIARGLLGDYVRPVNTKSVLADGDSMTRARKLSLYLSDPYMVGNDYSGGAFMQINLGIDGSFVIIYEDDSPTEGSLNEPVRADDSDVDDIFYDTSVLGLVE